MCQLGRATSMWHRVFAFDPATGISAVLGSAPPGVRLEAEVPFQSDTKVSRTWPSGSSCTPLQCLNH